MAAAQNLHAQAASTTVAADGTATVDLGPYGYDWVVTQTTVSTNVATGTPKCFVYRDNTNQSNFVEGTNSGNGDASNTRHLLPDGSRLYFVWSGATPGATATARVTGAQYDSGAAAGAVQW